MKAISLKQLKQEVQADTNQKDGNPFEFSTIDSFESLYENIQPGEIVAIAGRPGMGKTTFLHNLIVYQAIKKNENILFLSLRDKPATSLKKLNRMINSFNKDDETGFENILINNEQSGSAYKIKELVSKIIQKTDITAIYIDDLCELSFFNEFYSDDEDTDYFADYSESHVGIHDIAKLFNYLRFIASKYKIPVILSEEVSRRADFRSGTKTPMLSDIRSESLETLADKILLLHRYEYYGITEDVEGNSTKGILNLIIAKNNNGKAGLELQLKLNNAQLYF